MKKYILKRNGWQILYLFHALMNEDWQNTVEGSSSEPWWDLQLMKTAISLFEVSFKYFEMDLFRANSSSHTYSWLLGEKTHLSWI